MTGIGPDDKIQFDAQKQDQFRCPRRARPRRQDPAAPADRDLDPRRAAAARLVAAALAVLAADLGVSRGVVVEAYQQLTSEG